MQENSLDYGRLGSFVIKRSFSRIIHGNYGIESLILESQLRRDVTRSLSTLQVLVDPLTALINGASPDLLRRVV